MEVLPVAQVGQGIEADPLLAAVGLVDAAWSLAPVTSDTVTDTS